MPLRLLLTLLCLAGIAGYLDQEQKVGRFQRVDEWTLDFLMANSRSSFEKPELRDDVVLIEMREEERAEYASWPPPPIDWQTLLKGLQPYDPDLVVITSPLNWGKPTPDFTPALAQAMLAFPSVVLGVESELAEAESSAPAFLGDLETALPRFSRLEGDLSKMPHLGALVTAPDTAVRGSCELGLLSIREVKGEWRLPYAVREGESAIPTILAQTLARYSHSPYTTGHRLRLGPGAGAYLQNGVYVPLEVSGEFTVKAQDTVHTINALDLMAGDLADATSEADKALLKKASIVVIGLTTPDRPDQPPGLAKLYAQALNHVLSLPRLRMLSGVEEWGVWAIAILAALWIVLKVKRAKALKTGVIFILIAFVVSLLLFQSNLIWCPPTIPVSLIAVGTLLRRFLREKKPETASPTPTSTTTSV